MAQMRVDFDGGGSEPEVRAATDRARRRHPPLGIGRLAEEAVARRLQFRRKLAEPLEIEHLFE